MYIGILNKLFLSNAKIENLKLKFFKYCCNGNLEKAINIYNKYNKLFDFCINDDDFFIFRKVCINGHLNVAKWLYDLYPNNKIFYANNCEPLRVTCINGNLEFAKWIYENIDVNCCNICLFNEKWMDNYGIFRFVCLHGHLDVAKWLYSINKKIYSYEKYEISFRYACLNGHIELAKWLLFINRDINIFINNNQALQWATTNKHFDVVYWLNYLYVLVEMKNNYKFQLKQINCL